MIESYLIETARDLYILFFCIAISFMLSIVFLKDCISISIFAFITTIFIFFMIIIPSEKEVKDMYNEFVSYHSCKEENN